MKLPSPLIGALEAAINRLLETDPASEQRVQGLAGKRVRLQLTDLDLAIDFQLDPKRVFVESAGDDVADLEMRGTALSFARAALAPDEAGPGRGVQISGDADLARRFAELLQDADIDIEAILADHFGDSVAHLIGQGLRSALGFGRRTVQSLGRDTVEYFREETRDLVSLPEAEGWMREVEALRDGTERLEVRLKRLERGRP